MDGNMCKDKKKKSECPRMEKARKKSKNNPLSEYKRSF